MLVWSPDDLARRAKIHRRTLRKIEKGEADPQAKTLAQIIAALASGGAEFKTGTVRLVTGK